MQDKVHLGANSYDDILCAAVRRIAFVGDATYTKFEFYTFSNFSWNVGTQVELIIIQVSRTEDTFLVKVAHTDIELRLLVATGNADVVLCLWSHIRDNQVIPVRRTARTVYRNASKLSSLKTHEPPLMLFIDISLNSVIDS